MATSGRHRERARGAQDLGGIAVVAIEIELPVDHAAAGMNAGIGPSEIPLPIRRLAAIADDHQIAGLGLLERQPGALELGARPVLSFIYQYGVITATQLRVSSQSGQQALAEAAIFLALAEIDAAADGPAMEGRHRHAAMAGQRRRQMLREQPVVAQDQDALFRVFREQLRPGDQQYGLARAGHTIDDTMTISQGTRIALLAQVEHREIGLAGANDHLWMDDASEDVDLRRCQLRESPPRIETGLEPGQQGLRLEHIPGGQLLAGDGRGGWEQRLSSCASRSIWLRLMLLSTAMWQNGKA
jgi:hypothetical protein